MKVFNETRRIYIKTCCGKLKCNQNSNVSKVTANNSWPSTKKATAANITVSKISKTTTALPLTFQTSTVTTTTGILYTLKKNADYANTRLKFCSLS
jgi:hypothetical protein